MWISAWRGMACPRHLWARGGRSGDAFFLYRLVSSRAQGDFVRGEPRRNSSKSETHIAHALRQPRVRVWNFQQYRHLLDAKSAQARASGLRPRRAAFFSLEREGAASGCGECLFRSDVRTERWAKEERSRTRKRERRGFAGTEERNCSPIRSSPPSRPCVLQLPLARSPAAHDQGDGVRGEVPLLLLRVVTPSSYLRKLHLASTAMLSLMLRRSFLRRTGGEGVHGGSAAPHTANSSLGQAARQRRSSRYCRGAIDSYPSRRECVSAAVHSAENLVPALPLTLASLDARGAFVQIERIPELQLIPAAHSVSRRAARRQHL
ncbi:hypothetical protein K438DRAFT_1764856 [Mycena galopus ATCC 62051]|nr:hypothetical protein K438DRAFT_1764856 [Mycena galopus ATCC 62051]